MIHRWIVLDLSTPGTKDMSSKLLKREEEWVLHWPQRKTRHIFTQGFQQQEGQVEVSRTFHQRSEDQTFYNLHLGTVREVHV